MKADNADGAQAFQAQYQCEGLIRALFLNGDYLDFGKLFPKSGEAVLDLPLAALQNYAPEDLVFQPDTQGVMQIDGQMKIKDLAIATKTSITFDSALNTYHVQGTAVPDTVYPLDYSVGPVISLPAAGIKAIKGPIAEVNPDTPPAMASVAGNGWVKIAGLRDSDGQQSYSVVTACFWPFALLIPLDSPASLMAQFSESDMGIEWASCNVAAVEARVP